MEKNNSKRILNMNSNSTKKARLVKAERSVSKIRDIEATASSQPKIPKIFSFYAEKGGVGKTTICITLGYMFANSGKRVLIYDCDAQRSLTAWICGREIEENFNGDVNAFIDGNNIGINQPKTLYDQVSSNNLSPAYVRKINDNLFLVPGNVKTNELDAKIGFDETRSEGGYGVNNSNEVTGKPYRAILKTAQENNIDYILLDLSPYAGTLNRCLIMCSNYLIIPTIPDFFSAEMMRNMKENLIKWNQEIDKYRSAAGRGQYPLPEHKPKFLGYIMSRYYPNRKGPIINGIATDIFTHKEKRWIEEIEELVKKLTAELIDHDLCYENNLYEKLKRSFLLGYIREYRSLKNISDLLHIPVPFLTKEALNDYEQDIDIEERAQIQTDDLQRIDDFYQIFVEIVKNIKLIIQ